MLFANQDYSIQFSQPDNSTFHISFSVDNWELDEVVHDGVAYTTLNFSQSAVTKDKGFAELPFISTSFRLPDESNFNMEIRSAEYEDFQLNNPMLPSRGALFRSQDISKIPYIIAEESLKDEFYPVQLAIAEDPFIIRDVRGMTVRVYPFQWNAATGTLRVYKNILVELKQNNDSPINPLKTKSSRKLKSATGTHESMLINSKIYDLLMGEYGDILVITTARDEEAVQPYIDWKKEKGFDVYKEVVERGTNVKNLIQQSYNNNNDLMYVLLVGDWEDVQSDLDDQAGSLGPADPKLGNVSGDDNFPDIAIGRFSAESPEEVAVQVSKTIKYERNPNMEADWRETFIGVASNEGGLNVGDDNEIDYVHIQRIYNQRLSGFGYKTHKENYAPHISRTGLTNHINSGASTIAYCGHGLATSFQTTGYSVTDVNKSTNGDKLPFIVASACLAGKINYTYPCLGEVFLRKEAGGAITTWMSSIDQLWSPPQRGQDYFYDILTGGFDYSQYQDQSGLSTNEQRTHWGSITVNASCLMLMEYNDADHRGTVNTWITFGDPSIQLRTKQPSEIQSSLKYIPMEGDFTTRITSNGTPVANALVCISQNGEYKKGMTNSDGRVSIAHNFTEGEVLLVVTAFNTTTIYEKIPYGGASNIESDSFVAGITLYPNPVQEVLFIESEQSIDRIELFDVTGKKVYRQNVSSDEARINITETGLEKGVYFIRMQSQGKVPVTKTVIIK